MADAITTKRISKSSTVVTVTPEEYRAFLRWKRKLDWEIADTDEAIRAAERAKKARTLKLVHSFSSMIPKQIRKR